MSHQGPGRVAVFLRHSPCQHNLMGLSRQVSVVEKVILMLGRRNRNVGLQQDGPASVSQLIIPPRLLLSMEEQKRR